MRSILKANRLEMIGTALFSIDSVTMTREFDVP